jgi:hypothetical protein
MLTFQCHQLIYLQGEVRTIVTADIDLAKRVFAGHGADKPDSPALVRSEVPSEQRAVMALAKKMRQFCVRLRHRRCVFHKSLAKHGGEHRLYRADALALELSAPGAIDSALHALSGSSRGCAGSAVVVQ